MELRGSHPLESSNSGPAWATKEEPPLPKLYQKYTTHITHTSAHTQRKIK